MPNKSNSSSKLSRNVEINSASKYQRNPQNERSYQPNRDSAVPPPPDCGSNVKDD